MDRSHLEARDLVVARGGTRIVDGASLSLTSGEAVSVQGPSGSGKSTLVRALATLLPAAGGELLLDGTPVSSLPAREYRRRVAFLAQAAAMLPGTVAENLAAGPRLRGAELPLGAASALLDEVGLPRGLLHREARGLSGGEKQRVAVARALANDPTLLLLDEPTAALDPESARTIVDLLRALVARGRGVLMVTHAAEHAAWLGGRRLRCVAGRVSEER